MIPKPNRDVRLILNLESLNKFLKVQFVCMELVPHISRETILGQLTIKILLWKTSTFGPPTAPWMFTEVLASVLDLLGGSWSVHPGGIWTTRCSENGQLIG